MRDEHPKHPKRRRPRLAPNELLLETPPPTEDVQRLVEENFDASRYSEKLASEWRELLDESSGLDWLREGSLLFRPRAGIGLEPRAQPGLPSCRPGDVLDDFELLRLVAQGGMGQLWEARQRTLDRSVALKLIRPDRMSAEAEFHFQREGRAAGRLRHPAIVTVHAMGNADGVHWIAQEFIDGECTLADFLADVESAEALPPDYDRRIALFFFQLAEGLAYAHERKVSHRDLKPHNVLIAENDRPKLTDFGLARIEEEASGGSAALCGTPRYMSPEQARGRAEVDGFASDVFSLGTMLYQALTLQLAFDGDTVDHILMAVTDHVPVPCRAHRPSISPDLEAIVSRALEKDPAQRYRSMRAMAEDLAAFLDQRPVAARPVGPVRRTELLVRRRPLWAALLAGSLLALVAIGFLADAWQASRADARTERWNAQLFQAGLAFDRHDFAGLQHAVETMEATLPGLPDGHLLLAGWHAGSSRPSLAAGELEAAKIDGFEPTAGRADDARDQYLLGLYRLSQGTRASAQAAADALQRAGELDPTLPGVWYPLYIAALRLDDAELALVALDAFEAGLRVSDPRTLLVGALRKTQLGEYEDAVREFERVEAELPLERLETYAFSRRYGRALLLSHRYAAAVSTLERAVEFNPEDSDAWAGLAFALLMLGRDEATPERERIELLERADAAAEQSLATSIFDDEQPILQTLTLIEEARNQLQPVDEHTARERLAASFPDNPTLASLLAWEHFLAANEAWNQGDMPTFWAQLERSFGHSRDVLGAHVLAGQAHGFFGDGSAGDLERGAAHLDEAFELWSKRDEQREGQALFFAAATHTSMPRWVQPMLVTRTWVAARRGDAADFEESRRALEQHLVEAGGFITESELLTYAEALVIGEPRELTDAERAHTLYLEYLERAGIEPGGWPAAYDPTIQAILAGIEAAR